MSSKPVLFILGGHGKVALQLIKPASSKYQVRAVIRNASQSSDIEKLGGEAVVQSLADSSVQDFAKLLKPAQYVVWLVTREFLASGWTMCRSAGAGGKG
jgi:D-arabinose 1-dehydrogenase-like Zn-dependent alcohol dehydrogenase